MVFSTFAVSVLLNVWKKYLHKHWLKTLHLLWKFLKLPWTSTAKQLNFINGELKTMTIRNEKTIQNHHWLKQRFQPLKTHVNPFPDKHNWFTWYYCKAVKTSTQTLRVEKKLVLTRPPTSQEVFRDFLKRLKWHLSKLVIENITDFFIFWKKIKDENCRVFVNSSYISICKIYLNIRR